MAGRLAVAEGALHRVGALIRPTGHHHRPLQDHRSRGHGTFALAKRLPQVTSVASRVLRAQPLHPQAHRLRGRSHLPPTLLFPPSWLHSAPPTLAAPQSVVPAIFSRLIPPFLIKFFLDLLITTFNIFALKLTPLHGVLGFWGFGVRVRVCIL